MYIRVMVHNDQHPIYVIFVQQKNDYNRVFVLEMSD